VHPNPAFRNVDEAASLDFVRARAFGVLAVNADAGPLMSHVPFLLSGDAASADLHLVRSNPIARMNAGPAVIAVSGPDAYISPDWYGMEDQVPTWNYVAVHLRGRLEALPHEAMRDMLDRQSAAYETRLAPKRPWTADKMTPATLDRLMRSILPFRLHVEGIESTWKLGQNKPDEARLAAANGADGSRIGQETRGLAALMHRPPGG
jgi:transcriptional regulator